jgi:hypothetical protein
MRFLSISIVILSIPVLARADYHYASHSGSDEYPYTSWETAADSITPAMNAASPYDTIYIAAGDYQESVWADPEDTCLTFIGAGIDSTHVWENTTAKMWMAPSPSPPRSGGERGGCLRLSRTGIENRHRYTELRMISYYGTSHFSP